MSFLTEIKTDTQKCVEDAEKVYNECKTKVTTASNSAQKAKEDYATKLDNYEKTLQSELETIKTKKTELMAENTTTTTPVASVPTTPQ